MPQEKGPSGPQCLLYWAWTWNATDEDVLPEVKTLESFFAERSYVDQYVFQEETASRRHYQGKLHLKEKKAKATVLDDFRQAGFDVTQVFAFYYIILFLKFEFSVSRLIFFYWVCS